VPAGSVVLTITADEAQSLQAFRRLQDEQRKLAAGAAQVNQATSAGTRKAIADQKDHEHQVKMTTKALSKMGGEGGHMLMMLGRMGPQFGAIGIAAASVGNLVGVIGENARMWVDHQAKLIVQSVELNSEMEKTVALAEKAASARGAASLEKLGGISPAIAAGPEGKRLLALAQELTGEQGAGLAKDIANLLRKRTPEDAEKIIRAGATLQATGRASLSATLEAGAGPGPSLARGMDITTQRALLHRMGQRASTLTLGAEQAQWRASPEFKAITIARQQQAERERLKAGEAISGRGIGWEMTETAKLRQDIVAPGLTEMQKKLQDLNEEAKKKSEIAQEQSSRWWSYIPIGSAIAGKSRLEADAARQAAEQQAGGVVGMAQKLRPAAALQRTAEEGAGLEERAAAFFELSRQLQRNTDATNRNTVGSVGEAPRPAPAPGVRP